VGRRNSRWPIDLRVFGFLAALWALYLAWEVFSRVTLGADAEPLRAMIAGKLFYGEQARIVLLVQAGIFWTIAVGMLAGRRWSLALALLYMLQAILSHLVFIVAYLNNRIESHNVRIAAYEGPTIVLIALYLWIRSSDLIFPRASGS